MKCSHPKSLVWSILTNSYPLGCNPHFYHASYHSVLPSSNQNHCSDFDHHSLVSPVLELHLHQCFSIMVLFTLGWDNALLWGAFLCIVGCWLAASGLYLIATSTPSCDNQECLQTLQVSPELRTTDINGITQYRCLCTMPSFVYYVFAIFPYCWVYSQFLSLLLRSIPL